MSHSYIPITPPDLESPLIPEGEVAEPTAMLPRGKRGRAITNVIANSGNFAVNVLIGLWFTPYIIHHLGVVAYGFVPLATMLTVYLDVITVSLNAVVGRFITMAVEQGKQRLASQYFNSSLIANTAVVIFLWLPAWLLIRHVDRLIDVPPEYVHDVQMLFVCAVGVFTANAIANTFQASSFCASRFDLRNAAAISGAFVRVGLIVAAFAMFRPQLWHVGLGIAGDAFVVLVGAVLIHHYLLPFLRIRVSDFDWGALRELVSSGAWLMLGRVGAILYVQSDVLVVNLVLGAKAGGQYGALLAWPTMLRALSAVISTGLAPNIVYLHAHGKTDAMVTYIHRSVKMLGLILALPTGIICGFARPLLLVWLSEDFVVFAPLLIMMAVYLCVNLSLWPLFELMVAVNKVRVPGLTTIALGVGNVGLAVVLAGPAGMGMYGVALAGAIMLSVRSIVFGLYASKIMEQRRWTFFRELIPITASFAGIVAVCVGLAQVVTITSWVELIAAVAAVSAVYVGMLLTVVLAPDERALLTRLVMRRGRSSQ